MICSIKSVTPYNYFTINVDFSLYRPLSQKWWATEQFGYHIWIQQCQVYKDHPSFLQWREWCWLV